MIFDSDTGEYRNNYGVETRIPGFGQTYSIEHLDSLHKVPYFYEMVKFLKELDYVVGKSVRGAPYDWRLAASEQSKKVKVFFLQLFCYYHNKIVIILVLCRWSIEEWIL